MRKMRKTLAAGTAAIAMGLALTVASCGGAADSTEQLTPAGTRSNAGTSTGCGSVLIAGANWLRGQGVDVLSNGTGYLGSCTGGSAGYGYQCVDLAYRLYAARGWGTVHAAGNGGAYYIPEGSPVACVSFHVNGTYVPVPGDLIIENTSSVNGGYGHVAVVDSVSGSTINAVEQNTQSPSGGVWYDHPRHPYSIDGNNNIGGGYTSVRGVCHSSSNPFTNAPPPPVCIPKCPSLSCNDDGCGHQCQCPTGYTCGYLGSQLGCIAHPTCPTGPCNTSNGTGWCGAGKYCGSSGMTAANASTLYSCSYAGQQDPAARACGEECHFRPGIDDACWEDTSTCYSWRYYNVDACGWDSVNGNPRINYHCYYGSKSIYQWCAPSRCAWGSVNDYCY